MSTNGKSQAWRPFRRTAADGALAPGASATRIVTRHRVVKMPSYVAFDDVNGKLVQVGEAARLMEGKAPAHTVVLRPFRDGTVAHFQGASHYLRHVIKHSRRYPGMGAPRLLLAVPFESTPVERKSLQWALKHAGAASVQLVDRNVALAMGAGLLAHGAKATMLIHIGASSVQAAVAAVGKLVVSKRLAAGGDSWNEAIIDMVRRKYQVLIGDPTADALKCTIGCALQVDPEVSYRVGGIEMSSGLPIQIDVTSTDVCEALTPLLQEIMQQVRLIVTSLSCEVFEDLMQNGIVMTGGGSALGRLEEMLAQHTGLPVKRMPDAAEKVARGLQLMLEDRVLAKAGQLEEARVGAMLGDIPPRGKAAMAAVIMLACLALAATRLHASAMTCIAPPAFLQPRGHDAASTVELSEKDRQIQALLQQNIQLSSLLHRAPEHVSASVAGRVVFRDPTGWLSTVTLDVGAQNGVARQMVVTNADGLVGQVVAVMPQMSQVRLVTGDGSVIACRIEGSSATGVLYGHGDRTCELRYLDPDVNIDHGAQVVTSGQDGLFPPGIVVGTVLHLNPASDALYRSAVVQPATRFTDLSTVLVTEGSNSK
ncbi:MAG: rod shape-determining protein [Candidatus Xenobia bacterium]